MASSLFDKLLAPTVIPFEYTNARNAINRYTKQHDGYQVLRALIKEVHPGLRRNALISPPTSIDCDDIYDYATQFLMFEILKGRLYNPRDQMNKFFGGLDMTYEPALQRLQPVIDTWMDDRSAFEEEVNARSLHTKGHSKRMTVPDTATGAT